MDWGLATGDFPLIGFIGRLADQKGADLILAAGDQLLAETEAQFAILGLRRSDALQHAFTAWAERAPRPGCGAHGA